MCSVRKLRADSTCSEVLRRSEDSDMDPKDGSYRIKLSFIEGNVVGDPKWSENPNNAGASSESGSEGSRVYWESGRISVEGEDTGVSVVSESGRVDTRQEKEHLKVKHGTIGKGTGIRLRFKQVALIARIGRRCV